MPASNRLGRPSDRMDGLMRHYRIEKVAKPGGAVLKRRDILAASDQEAIKRAEDSSDCPICDVLRDGKPIGSVA